MFLYEILGLFSFILWETVSFGNRSCVIIVQTLIYLTVVSLTGYRYNFSLLHVYDALVLFRVFSYVCLSLATVDGH